MSCTPLTAEQTARADQLAESFRLYGGRDPDVAALRIIIMEAHRIGDFLGRWSVALRMTKLGPTAIYESFSRIGMED